MLQSLVELHDKLADRLPPVAYKKRPIAWVLRLQASGEPEGGAAGAFVETSDRMDVPDRSRRGSAVRPRLVDNAEYMFGVAEEGKEKRAAKRHKKYMELLRRAGSEIESEAISAYCKFAEQPKSFPADMDRSDLIIVRVDGKALHESTGVRAWWADFIDEVTGEKITERGPCAICGENKSIARIHNEIRYFNAALSSFKEQAYQSYGKTQSYGAWTCQKCARKISRALTWLFDSDDHRYYFNDVSWVFWTKEPQPAISLNPLKDGDPNKIRQLLSSYHDGTLVDDEKPLWALALESNEGRLIVKHLWQERTGRVKANLARYFEAMETGGRYFGAYALMMSLIQTANGSRSVPDIPSWIEAGLVQTALTGRPLPTPFLLAALDRNQALGQVSAPRAALLKLYLISHRHDMPSALNPDHESQAYHLGRLFATLEYAQYKALGSTNATITDRFFASASTSPCSVFGNLIGKAQAHLAKMRKADPGAHSGIQKQLGTIMSRIADFPATLAPEQQALFSLGYYHQREERFAGAATSDDASDDGNAPDDDEQATGA